MSGMKQIKCPHCKGVIDVQPDWEGCDGECPHCQNVFKIHIPKETDETKAAGLVSRLAAISNQELQWVVEYFRKKTNGQGSSEYSSLIPQVQRILNEISRRMGKAKEIGDAEKKNSLSFPLNIFAFLICKYRKPTRLEQFLSALGSQTQQQLNQLNWIAEEARRKEEIRRMNEELARKKNEVADFAALVHRLHAIPPVNYPHMSYQQNEHPCLVMKDVDGVSCSKVDESYYGGTLVVTNKRVFFMSPTHQQVYRLQNLIEYFSDWDYYNGTIKLSTSERRSEQYQMPGVWKAAFVISFFCDPMFRQSILQGSEGQAKATALSKVEASIMRGPCSWNQLEVKTDGRRRSSDNYDPYKNCVDISDKGLVGGMVSSFFAGLQGKGIITALDKETWSKPNGRRH